jgi:hypothetical protein
MGRASSRSSSEETGARRREACGVSAGRQVRRRDEGQVRVEPGESLSSPGAASGRRRRRRPLPTVTCFNSPGRLFISSAMAAIPARMVLTVEQEGQ